MKIVADEMGGIKVGCFGEKCKEFQLDSWTVGQLDGWTVENKSAKSVASALIRVPLSILEIIR